MEQLAIKTGGFLSILLGIGHCYFYRGFGWEKEFEKISLLNAKVLYTIHIFLIPFFFLFGYLSWAHSSQLAGGSTLGITLTLFYSLFWFLRTSWQIIYLTPLKTDSSIRLQQLHYFLTTYFFVLCCTYSIPIFIYFLS